MLMVRVRLQLHANSVFYVPTIISSSRLHIQSSADELVEFRYDSIAGDFNKLDSLLNQLFLKKMVKSPTIG